MPSQAPIPREPKLHAAEQHPGLLYRLFISALMRRLDRYLLIHHPLLWRTKVHYFAWFSLLIGNGALFVLGKLVPLEPANVPTAEQIDTGVAALRVLSAIALLYWCYVQYRLALEELRLRHYLLIGAMYALCFLSVLANPLSLVVPLVQRIATLVPDAAFEREYAVHERYGFWCCHPEITPEIVEQNHIAIIEGLRKYGLERWDTLFDASYDSPSYGGPYCPSGQEGTCLSFRTVTGEIAPLLFRDRLQSIHAAKRFDDATGLYFERYVRPWPSLVLVSGMLGAALVLAVYPASARRRRYGRGRDRPLPQLRLPQPTHLQRLDLYLRTHHPLVWSVRIHSFLFNALAYGSLALLAFVLAWWSFFGELDLDKLLSQYNPLYAVGSLLSLGAVLPAVWAVQQNRIPFEFSARADNQLAMLLYFLAALPLPAMLYACLWRFELLGSIATTDRAATGLFMFLGCAYLVGFVFVRKHMSAKELALAFAVSIGIVAGGITMLVVFRKGSETAAISFLLGWAMSVLAVWVLDKKNAARRGAALLSAAYLMAFPPVLLFSVLHLDTWLGMDEILAIWIPVLFGIPFYLVFGVPAINILVRYHYGPKAE